MDQFVFSELRYCPRIVVLNHFVYSASSSEAVLRLIFLIHHTIDQITTQCVYFCLFIYCYSDKSVEACPLFCLVESCIHSRIVAPMASGRGTGRMVSAVQH